MFEIVLHTGVEHPNLTSIVLSSILTFIAGLGIGTYSTRFREWTQTVTIGSADSDGNND